ncbi:hypothetical protein FGO68_gene13196 [Halteria grandinella]|uniref:Palmitoyltransferase n=1 Tax=Halteria grandinella TaxID=5974 RepID=A0A8J8NAE9_HALGN|nr:hypothetical protein FGO68_gene13196 [Halteria grandinella]
MGVKRWRFCQKCQVFKLPRMHHCSVCNRCCVRYDHHCGMAMNCIGVNNYHLFVTFLSSTIFSAYKHQEHPNWLEYRQFQRMELIPLCCPALSQPLRILLYLCDVPLVPLAMPKEHALS